MDTIQTLGKILPKNHIQGRDAVHIAVMPVIAGEDLRPGMKLKLKFGTTNVVIEADYGEFIGRADPFIEHYEIKTGCCFWMWLNPGSISGLRHEWEHPTIDKKPKKLSVAEIWLHQFAEKWNFDYDEMIREAKNGGYALARGRDLHSSKELDVGDEELFWKHIEEVTGQTYSLNHKKDFQWSCSC